MDYESMWKKFRMYLEISRSTKETCSITSVTGDHPRPCWAKDQIQKLINQMDEMEAAEKGKEIIKSEMTNEITLRPKWLEEYINPVARLINAAEEDYRFHIMDKVMYRFHDIYGLQSAFDVFTMLTSKDMYLHFNEIVDEINEELDGESKGISFNIPGKRYELELFGEAYHLEKLDKPLKPCNELFAMLSRYWNHAHGGDLK